MKKRHSLLCLIVFLAITTNADIPTPELHGMAQWDFDYFDGLYNDDKNGSEATLRRGRFIVKGKLPDQFSYKMTTNYNNNNRSVELLEAFLRYEGFEHFDITLGRFKEPFGMEGISSVNWISTIERSAIMNAPRPIKAGLFIDAGIMINDNNQQRTWSLALVDDSANDEQGRDLYGLTGRYSFSPINNKKKVLHFGIAHAYKDIEQGTPFSINEFLSVGSGNASSFLSPNDIAIDNFSQTGLEFAYRHKSVLLQSEYIYTDIDSSENADPSVASYYVVATYLLGNKYRLYKNGAFGFVSPYSKNTIELVAKYEANDINNRISEGILSDAKANTYTVGVNIYVNKNIKVAVNYLKSHTEALGPLDSGNALTARLQFVF